MDDEEITTQISVFWIIIILIAIVILLMIVLDQVHLYKVKGEFYDRMNEDANIAIIMAMDDEYRKDGISKIDNVIAINEFYVSLMESLNLDYNLHYEKDAVEYYLEIKDIRITESPPSLEAITVLHIKPLFVQGLVERYLGDNLYFEIPINVKSRNQRLD